MSSQGREPQMAPTATAASQTAPVAALLGGERRALRPSTKVLPEQARSHNRSLVLQTLYRQGPLSRADLARETGLTRVTVGDLIGELIGEGLAVELGSPTAHREAETAKAHRG